MQLRDGPLVSVDAVALALDFETRGITLREDQGTLKVAGPDGSRPNLTDDEPAKIRRLKPHLLAIVAYCAQNATEPQQAQQPSVSD